MRFSCLIPLALLVVVACNPPAVDPDAVFTIQGSLADETDSSPGSGVNVYFYKIDSIFGREDNFLQYDSIDVINSGGPPNATYSTQTDANGDFAIDLEGRQVNTDGGGGAAWLTAVYFDSGTEDDYLATATDWHAFSDADPIWDVGT
ncbi:MAG: hypothetical protein V3T05_02775, partial [Myxococcota bacterium]